MAACGLPQTRDDHAVVMARFARDCLHRYPTILLEMSEHLGPGVKELGKLTRKEVGEQYCRLDDPLWLVIQGGFLS